MNRKVYQTKKEVIDSLIHKGDKVLDVGFWGQGVTISDPNWPHNLIKNTGADVWGLDLDFDTESFKEPKYKKVSAEEFNFDEQFDVIFAGDLIEHLSNPGLFLQSVNKHLKSDGRLIVTTPNAFHFFNLTSKLMHEEPPVNNDHTCYFNSKTITTLLKKNDFNDADIRFSKFEMMQKESVKKRLLNFVYKFLFLFTHKYAEEMVVVVKKA